MDFLTFHTFCDSGLPKVARNNYSYRHLGEVARQSEEKLGNTIFKKVENALKSNKSCNTNYFSQKSHFPAPLCLIYCRSNDKCIFLECRNCKNEISMNFLEFSSKMNFAQKISKKLDF